MERGEQSSAAIAMLSVIGIVGVLATLAFFLHQPAGLVYQGVNIYPTAYADICLTKEAYFLGYSGAYSVYCCKEYLIGQNECRKPIRMLINY